MIFIFKLSDSDFENYYDRLNTNSDEDKVIIFKNATFSWAKPSHKYKPYRKNRKNKGKSTKRISRANKQRRDSTSSSEFGTPNAPFELKDISLEIYREAFIGVTGKVGSGKTSFLLSIVGEMLKKNGDIQIPDTLNMYLLDDVLSGLDGIVAQHIMQRCLLGLLRHTTRVLVTHSQRHLVKTNYIVLLHDGQIIKQGSPESILQNMEEFMLSETDSIGEEPPRASESDAVQDFEDSVSRNSLDNEETMSEGNVGWWVVYMYLRSVGSFMSVIILISLILMQLSQNFTFLWLTFWVKNRSTHNSTNITEMGPVDIPHENMTLLDHTFTGVDSFGAIVVTVYGLPWLIVAFLPLSLIYYQLQRRYRATSRQLKRLQSVTLSPVYTHFNDTLEGLITIRAMGASSRWAESGEEWVESWQRAALCSAAASQWLALRLQACAAAVTGTAALLAVLQRAMHASDPGLVGLAISYALSMTSMLSGVLNTFTETEREMISVERIGEYIRQVNKMDK
ncbi:hypothetical protein ACJJTC_009260 [Scirpophaga incertulas]